MTLFNASGEVEHAALPAADAAQAWKIALWTRAITAEAAAGRTFSADTLALEYDLPDMGNGTGGVFLRLRQEGKIRKVGYRPSDKPSRAGGVVAIWGRP